MNIWWKLDLKKVYEATLYIKHKQEQILIMSLYVDGLLMTESNEELITKFKQQMESEFEMTDLELITYFLGMEIQQQRDEVLFIHAKYAKEILKTFRMDECKAINTLMFQKGKLQINDGTKTVDEEHKTRH